MLWCYCAYQELPGFAFVSDQSSHSLALLQQCLNHPLAHTSCGPCTEEGGLAVGLGSSNSRMFVMHSGTQE